MSIWQRHFISRIGMMLLAVGLTLIICSLIASATNIMDNKGYRIAVAIPIYALIYFIGIYLFDKVMRR